MAPHLLHVFSTFKLGGPQRRFVQLANAFGPSYRHSIIALDGQTQASSLLSSDVEAQVLTFQPVKGRLRPVANLRAIWRLLSEQSPDLLLTYNWGAMEWTLANRFWGFAPELHFEDGFGPEEADGRQLARRVWTRRLAIGGRSGLIVPSRNLATIAGETWRIAVENTHFVPNGIEVERFAGAAAGRCAKDDGVVVGTVCALRPEKNLGRLIRCFSQLRDLPVTLQIAGDGPERLPLEWLVRELGLADRIQFLGHIDDAAPVYAGFDIFALSSDTEQMPYSVLEAMAAGLPIVATDVGDVHTMLSPDYKSSSVVPVKDEDGFTEKLRQLVRSPSGRQAVGAANQQFVRQHYSLERMVDCYNRLFQRAINRGKHNRLPAAMAQTAA